MFSRFYFPISFVSGIPPRPPTYCIFRLSSANIYPNFFKPKFPFCISFIVWSCKTKYIRCKIFIRIHPCFLRHKRYTRDFNFLICSFFSLVKLRPTFPISTCVRPSWKFFNTSSLLISSASANCAAVSSLFSICHYLSNSQQHDTLWNLELRLSSLIIYCATICFQNTILLCCSVARSFTFTLCDPYCLNIEKRKSIIRNKTIKAIIKYRAPLFV